MSIISALGLLYRMLTIVSGKFRTYLLNHTRHGHTIQDLSCLTTLGNIGYGQWFLFKHISKNVDPLTFKTMLTQYHEYVKCPPETRNSIYDVKMNDKLSNVDGKFGNKNVFSTLLVAICDAISSKVQPERK